MVVVGRVGRIQRYPGVVKRVGGIERPWLRGPSTVVGRSSSVVVQ